MDTDPRLICGTKLRKAREALGLTQAALAAKLGVSQPVLHRWEVGQTEPEGLNRRRLLAEVLGTDPYAIEPAPPSAVPDSSPPGESGPSTEVPVEARAS